MNTKKYIIMLSTIVIMVVFATCDKNEIEDLPAPAEKPVYTNEQGLNVFPNAAALQNLIETNATASLNNRTYDEPKRRGRSMDDDDAVNRTEARLADLIPDENFRNVVSKDGKFIVGDTIYQIRRLGTLFCSTKFADELSKIDSIQVANSSYIADKLKKIGNVYVYETFAFDTDLDKDIEIEFFDNETEDPSKSMLRATAENEPNINSFHVKSSARFTVLGKWRDALLGQGKWHYEPIKEHYRLGAKLYDYNYLVYSAIGLSAKVQHNNTWFHTWGIVGNWDKNLTIGWQDLVYKVNMPDMQSMPAALKPAPMLHQAYSEINSSADFSRFPFAVGNDQKCIVIPFYGEHNFTMADVQEMIYKFAAKQLFSQLNAARNSANGFLVDVPSQKVRYIYIANSHESVKGREINHVFVSSGLNFEVHWGNTSDFSTYLFKSFQASKNMKNFSLVSGKVYAYTQKDDGSFVGMVIRKVN